MQILRQFGELSPDLIDMQRYAAWKAGDIRKALREGRTPTAGAPASAANAEQDLLDELGLPSVPGKHLLKGCTEGSKLQQSLTQENATSGTGTGWRIPMVCVSCNHK